jgi:glycosyltransferase involved in cell wall biosynthesis
MQIGLNAQLLNSSDSYRSAGVSNYSLHLLRELGALATSGASSHNFTAWVNDRNVTIDGVDLVRSDLPLQQPVARIIWEQTVLPRTLQERHIDLVHGLVNVLPLATQVPGVVTVHDLSFVRLPETLPRAKRAYLRRLCAASVARARRVIAVSRQTADDVLHAFGIDATRIVVIPNGVDASFSPGDAAENAEFRKDRGLPERFILYLGTLEPRKNLPLLLRAYAAWRAQTAMPVPLYLAGGQGWFYDEIFQLAQELGIAAHVHFPGYIPQTELVDWYRAATIFVYPSRFEGFGLPVLEAMACGTPVLCSDAPSLLEAAGNAALIFPRNEDAGVPALAALLEQALSNPALRQKLRLLGLEQARRFSWAQTAAATLTVYDEVGSRYGHYSR